MKYWKEMLYASGFNDGDCYPDGVDVYRDVYIKAVNVLAEKNKSDWRYVPYDSQGGHNNCRVCSIHREKYNEEYLPYRPKEDLWPGLSQIELLAFTELIDDDADDGMSCALNEAYELNLDDYVDVAVTISPDFSQFLTELKEESVDSQE